MIYDEVVELQSLVEGIFDHETGEIKETEAEAFDALEKEIVKGGLERLCKVRANLIAKTNALKEEKTRIDKKKSLAEKEVERIENYIKMVFDAAKKDKVDAGTFTVSYRQSEQVNLIDGFENKDFGSYEFKADKTSIKKALKEGEKIEGASIVVNLNLQIK